MNYNKGEWSEAYVFVKLLGDGRVYAADEEQNKKPDEFYPVLKIIKDNISRHYVRSQEDEIIQIVDLEGNIKKELTAQAFLDIAEYTLEEIKTNSGNFKIRLLEEFLKGIEIVQIKSPSQSKSDLKMEILDLKTDLSNVFSFSIKSELGSKSTLLNASQATNFQYRIEGIEQRDVDILNSITKDVERWWLKARMSTMQKGVLEKRYNVFFEKMVNGIFEDNLRVIDSSMPYILSEILMDFYTNEEGITSVDELTERLIESNPMRLSDNIKALFYKTKIIDLLKAATFGMRPATTWDRKYKVSGGMISVKISGEILCYHIFYNANALDEYLYRNTKLETASTKRFKTGEIIEEDNYHVFTLNLQIRMK